MARGQMGTFKACIFIVLLGYCTKQRSVSFKSYQWIKQANIAVVHLKTMAHFPVFSSLKNKSILKLTNRLLPE